VASLFAPGQRLFRLFVFGFSRFVRNNERKTYWGVLIVGVQALDGIQEVD
jgi:hypothetical protein